MNCSVETELGPLTQFLLNTMVMHKISARSIVRSIVSFYITMGRHRDALERVRKAAGFIRATQPDDRARDASALSRYRTLAADIASRTQRGTAIIVVR